MHSTLELFWQSCCLATLIACKPTKPFQQTSQSQKQTAQDVRSVQSLLSNNPIARAEFCFFLVPRRDRSAQTSISRTPTPKRFVTKKCHQPHNDHTRMAFSSHEIF